MNAGTAESIDELVADSRDPIVTVTRDAARLLIFNRPEARNAMTRDMRRDYSKYLREADSDPEIRCVIVTGAHGYFSAGVDIKEQPPATGMPMVRPHPVEASRAMTKPVIAMIDGPCMTGALELALACSFLLGSDRSSYADTHLKLGIIPGWGGVSLLAGAIGRRRAAQLQISGEKITAQTALDWGLVNEIVPHSQLVSRSLELARGIAAIKPAVLHRYVEINRRIDGMRITDALAAELTAVDLFRSTL